VSDVEISTFFKATGCKSQQKYRLGMGRIQEISHVPLQDEKEVDCFRKAWLISSEERETDDSRAERENS